MRIFGLFKRLILAFLVFGFSFSAAAQTIFVSDGDTIKAELSLLHPTRMYFEYDAGSQLIFNQVEGATPEVSASVDSKGDVYLSVVQGISGETISGFLTTQGGVTYVIDLTLKQKPASQIKIVNTEAMQKAKAALIAKDTKSEKPLKTVKWSKNGAHHNTVAELMVLLYADQAPEGFKLSRQYFSKSVEIEDGLTRRTSKKYDAENLELITYDIVNTNAHFINPEDEKRWFNPYIALAFSTDNLEAGESGKVFVIRAKGKADE